MSSYLFRLTFIPSPLPPSPSPAFPTSIHQFPLSASPPSPCLILSFSHSSFFPFPYLASLPLSVLCPLPVGNGAADNRIDMLTRPRLPRQGFCYTWGGERIGVKGERTVYVRVRGRSMSSFDDGLEYVGFVIVWSMRFYGDSDYEVLWGF